MSKNRKKVLWHVVRLLVAAALVAYVVSRANLRDTVRPEPDADPLPVLRETAEGTVVRAEDGGERLVPCEDLQSGRAVRVAGIIRIARRLGADWGWAVAALGVMLLQSPIGAVRWRLLLRVQGIRITLLQSLRLTYVGWFFNNWMPGATGGDFVKAYYIAKQTRKKPEAVTVVFLDRFVGVVSLSLLGAAAVCVSLGDERLRVAQYIIAGFLGLAGVGTVVFYSHRVRRLLRVDRLLARLPLGGTVARVERALFTYRRHKRTVALAVVYSWAAQVVAVLCMWWLATGLGSRAQVYHYFVNMPAIWIGWSLIPVPGGFGVAETLAQNLFNHEVLGGAAGMAAAEAATLALAMILAYRLVQMAVSLPGAVFYLARRSDVPAAQMRARMESARMPQEDDAARNRGVTDASSRDSAAQGDAGDA